MSDISEWLDRTTPESFQNGITALDLLDLPTNLNTIMHLILTQVRMTEPELRAAVTALPEASSLSTTELTAVLEALCARHWLLRTQENETTVYQVNLRTREKRPRAMKKVWDALDFDS